jgi:hypothetical protein
MAGMGIFDTGTSFSSVPPITYAPSKAVRRLL